MEALLILAKINAIFQVCEKVVWGCVGLWGVKTGVRYYSDYKDAQYEEQIGVK